MNLLEFLKGSNVDYDWIKSMLTRDWTLIARLEKAWRSVRVFHFSDSVRIKADSRIGRGSRLLRIARRSFEFFSFSFFNKLFLSENSALKMDDESAIIISTRTVLFFIYPRINLPVRDSIADAISTLNKIKIVFSSSKTALSIKWNIR